MKATTSLSKKLRVLSLVLVFAMLAAFVPVLSDGGATSYAAGDFTVEDGTLTKYTGSGGNIIIPVTVKVIGEKVFYNNTSITGVTIPSTVTTVGAKAFYGCKALESVKFADNVATIGEDAFYECEKLGDVTLPKKLSSISPRSFLKCSSMTAFAISDTNETFEVSKGVLYNKTTKTLVSYPCGKTDELYTVKNGTETVSTYAFFKNEHIKKVNFTSAVKTIGSYAFAYCSNLATIPFLPSALTKIDSCSFRSTAITDISIPVNVTVLGGGVFSDCRSLSKISVASGNAKFKVLNEALMNSAETVLYAFPQNCSRTLYSMPDTITTIRYGAFEGNRNLKAVSLSTSLNTVDYYAFKNCESLAMLGMYEGMTVIGDSMFMNCKKLTAVTVPSTVKKISYGAFFGTSVASVNWNAIAPDFGSIAFPKTVETVKYAGTKDDWDAMRNSSGKTVDYAFESSTMPTVTYSTNPIIFIAQPKQRSSVKEDETFTLSTQARSSSGGLTYEWYYKLADSEQWSLWNGEGCKTSTTSIKALYTLDKAEFYCIVKDAAGKTAKTNVVRLNVIPFIKVITQPASQTVNLGDSITLSTAAEGEGMTYQWYYKKKGQTSFSKWNSRTKATETVTPNATWDGIQLYCRIADNTGHYVNTDKVTVTVTNNVRITKQPVDQTVNLGDSIILSLTAQGDGLTYQWYYKKKGASAFSPWNNRTHASETVTPNATWDGIQLYCIVKDSGNHSVQSDIITVTVTNELRITKQPVNQTVNLGDSVTLSLKASGAGLTYQWYYKKKGQTSFSVWNGRTHASETVTPNATWDGIQLYCLIKDSGGHSVPSDVITVTVTNEVKITQQPVSQTVTLGNSITLSLKASGSGLTYQWYFKKKGASAFSPWNGHTHASEAVTPNASWDGIQLYCVVKDSGNHSVTSDTITITVIQGGPVITQQPVSQTVTLGNSITLSLKASGSGLTYQWYFKKAGQTSFSPWNGHTHASEAVTPNASWNGIQLYCVVKDSGNHSVTSDTVTITVK